MKSPIAPVMANRVAGILSQMFRFGIHGALIETTPVQLLYRPGGKEKPRARVLSEEELKAFLRNLDDACRFQRLPFILRALLLTLQRRSEVDFKARTWTIPDAHAKTGEGHVVPLSDWAIQDLEKLKVMAGGSRFILPSIDKRFMTCTITSTRNARRSRSGRSILQICGAARARRRVGIANQVQALDLPEQPQLPALEHTPIACPNQKPPQALGARGTTYRLCAREPAECFAYQVLLENHDDAYRLA